MSEEKCFLFEIWTFDETNKEWKKRNSGIFKHHSSLVDSLIGLSNAIKFNLGVKCCVHVHGFLPYIIFRTRSRVTPQLHAYFIQIITEIISQTPFARLISEIEGGAIFDIFDERAISMYGYHENADHFVRVVFCDPKIAKLCAYAFQRECSINPISHFLQPYNAHMPAILQFFIDFSIHGMEFVRLSTRYQRVNLNSKTSAPIQWGKPNGYLYFVAFMKNNIVTADFRNLRKSPLRPQSNMALEFDVFTDDILNPYFAINSRYNIQGLEFIWAEERSRCELVNVDLQAFTPGEVGAPEVWTEHEEALRNELKQTLERFCNSRSQSNKTGHSSSQEFESVWGSQQGQLSQQVIENLQSQFSDEQTFTEAGNQQAMTSGAHFVDQSSVSCIGTMKSKKVTILDDCDDNEEDGNSETDDLEFQQDSTRNNAPVVVLNPEVRNADSSEEEEEENNSSFDDLEIICSNSFSQGANSNKINQTDNRSNHYYETVEPWTNTPITIWSRDENPEVLVEDQNHQPIYEVLKTPIKRNNLPINETWNCSNILGETPSHIEIPLEEKVDDLTRSQDEYNKLMRTVKSTVDNLCVLSVEILSLTSQPDIRPVADPKHDYVSAIFYAVDVNVCNRGVDDSSNDKSKQFRGCIALNKFRDCRQLGQTATDYTVYVSHEMQLFAELTNIVHRYDPDILIGYDTTRFSWGFLFERAEFLGLPFLYNISRIKDPRSCSGMGLFQTRRESFRPPHGRIQLEVWRIVRKETTNLRSFNFSAVVKALIKRNFPDIAPETMSDILKEAQQNNIYGIKNTIANHFLDKCNLNIDLLDKLDIFIKTSQMARVYGIQFAEVLSRGSQFRVESILLRLAARQKFVAPSISEIQRNLMGSPETIPLNLEPESSIYYDPVVVLDFQSLYPSICVAYNYCFTTCLGKLTRLKALLSSFSSTSQSVPKLKLGALCNYELYNAKKFLKLLNKNEINISPTGGVFLKAQIRKSLLAQMLQELLDTRVMVKKAMKVHSNCEWLQRTLDARQLALKLVSNVTYGYTAANWSGRMPCEELADAIVSKGRETLERAIQMIHENSRSTKIGNKKCYSTKYGNARVIYGDTDSLFVLFEGQSRAEAFRLGEQIAADVSASNPYPVKLKFEKVMQPCALITKKRYVGMSYESNNQKMGKFDAKGIETVRIDACEFVSKTLENVLRLLFNVPPPVPNENDCQLQNIHNGGLETALQYLKYRLLKIREIPLTEFMLSNSYRDHYSPAAVLPVKKIAGELSAKSPRLTPLRGERVSYIIALNAISDQKSRIHSTFKHLIPATEVKGSVTSSAVSINDFLDNPSLEVYYDYYVTRQLLPALTRFFQLIGVRLKWRTGEAFRNFCLGCKTPNLYPWCAVCAKSATSLVVRRSTQLRHFSSARLNCRDCLGIVKSLSNIEDKLALQNCTNFACNNRKGLMLAERALLSCEFKSHMSSHSLRHFSYF